jgi:hypothetical protein
MGLIMDAFSPEFTAFWLAEPAQAPARQTDSVSNDNNLSTSQQVALEELAERVNAARRVV